MQKSLMAIPDAQQWYYIKKEAIIKVVKANLTFCHLVQRGLQGGFTGGAVLYAGLLLAIAGALSEALVHLTTVSINQHATRVKLQQRCSIEAVYLRSCLE